jgi:hypothetical protein
MSDPWWRLYCEMISDRKFKYISKICGLSKIQLIGAWVIICTLAHESPRYGALLVTSQLRITVTDLAEELEISQEIVEKMIAAMVDKGMLIVEPDGTFFVQNLQKRQYKDLKAAQRTQKYRQSLHATSPVTSPVTLPETETETETKAEKIGAKPRKPPKKADERTSHPAIVAFKEIVTRYPAKALYDKVIEILGTDPNKSKAQACWVDWLSRGYNSNSIGWLDWYQSGIPPRNGHAAPSVSSIPREDPAERARLDAAFK